ncbi:N-acetyltransferase [Staphylococcus muscae]|uniref:Acetyltransferase family protein n=1 Tax=Staphylococcus muscae TaxID=1294 RepID=A0A240BZ05_9STAP|nr:GNAT family N-acetyltransferase [Staphylococcus muscae]AVQ34454.1 N-acetyltransferase [Staphylococcus muscae]PNZ03012.1 N-acetyltransferase [Staphylococcus muscae]GGA92933.1 N-acetyltransferase [Staphylococcus muscae]SNW00895.1 acetyltransferase family protein [Staphylococcus muscae]
MIRPCTLEDLKVLQAISCQAFDETFGPYNKKEHMDQHLATAYTDEKLTKELQNPNSYFYFIYAKNELAGYLKLNAFDAQTEPFDEQHFEIERIYLLSQFQKQGLGAQLYNKALEVAKSLNCKYIWLGVWEKNENAIAFYQKNGFEKVGAHTFYMGDDPQTDYIMKTAL